LSGYINGIDRRFGGAMTMKIGHCRSVTFANRLCLPAMTGIAFAVTVSDTRA
jgi:hypothetical protein